MTINAISLPPLINLDLPKQPKSPSTVESPTPRLPSSRIHFLELPRDIEEHKVMASGLMTSDYQVVPVENESPCEPSFDTVQNVKKLILETKANEHSILDLWMAQRDQSGKVKGFAIVGSGARLCVAEKEITELFEKRGLKHLLFNADGSPTLFLNALRTPANDTDGRTILKEDTNWDDIEESKSILQRLVPDAFFSAALGEFITFRKDQVDIAVGKFTSSRFSAYLFENTRFEIHISASFDDLAEELTIRYETFNKHLLQFLCYQGLDIIEAENPKSRNYCAIVNYFIKILKGANCHNPSLVPQFFIAFFEKYKYLDVNWPVKAASMMRHIVEAHTKDKANLLTYLAFFMEISSYQVPECYQHLLTPTSWQRLWKELFNDSTWHKFEVDCINNNPIYMLCKQQQLPAKLVESLMGIAGVFRLSFAGKSPKYSLTNYQEHPSLYVEMPNSVQNDAKPFQLLLKFDLCNWIETLLKHRSSISDAVYLELLFTFWEFVKAGNEQSLFSKYPSLLLDKADTIFEIVQTILVQEHPLNYIIASISLLALSESGHKQSHDVLLTKVLPALMHINTSNAHIIQTRAAISLRLLEPYYCEHHTQDVVNAINLNNWWLALLATKSTYLAEITLKHFLPISIAERQQILTLAWQIVPLETLAYIHHHIESFPIEYLSYIFTQYPLNLDATYQKALTSDSIKHYISFATSILEERNLVPIECVAKWIIEHRRDLHLSLYYLLLQSLETDPNNIEQIKLLNVCKKSVSLTEFYFAFKMQLKASRLVLAKRTFNVLSRIKFYISAKEHWKEYKQLAADFVIQYTHSLDPSNKAKFLLSINFREIFQSFDLQNQLFEELILAFDNTYTTSTTHRLGLIVLKWLKATSKSKNYSFYIGRSILNVINSLITQSYKPQYLVYQLIDASCTHFLYKDDAYKNSLHLCITQFCRQSCDYPLSFPINKAARLLLAIPFPQNKLLLDVILHLINSSSKKDLQFCYALAKKVQNGSFTEEENQCWQEVTRKFSLVAYHLHGKQCLQTTVEMIRINKLLQDRYLQMKLDELALSIKNTSYDILDTLNFFLCNKSGFSLEQLGQLKYLLDCYIENGDLHQMDWIYSLSSYAFLSQEDKIHLIYLFLRKRKPPISDKLIQLLIDELPTTEFKEKQEFETQLKYIFDFYLQSNLPKKITLLNQLHPIIPNSLIQNWNSFTLELTEYFVTNNKNKEAIESLKYLNSENIEKLKPQFVKIVNSFIDNSHYEFEIVFSIFITYPTTFQTDSWIKLWNKIANDNSSIDTLCATFMESFPLDLSLHNKINHAMHSATLGIAFTKINRLAQHYIKNPYFIDYLKILSRYPFFFENLFLNILKKTLELKNTKFANSLIKTFSLKIFDSVVRAKVCFLYLAYNLNNPLAIYTDAMANQLIRFYTSVVEQPSLQSYVALFLNQCKNIDNSCHTVIFDLLSFMIETCKSKFNNSIAMRDLWHPTCEGLLTFAKKENFLNTETNYLFWLVFNYSADSKNLFLKRNKKSLQIIFEKSIIHERHPIHSYLTKALDQLKSLGFTSAEISKLSYELFRVYLPFLKNKKDQFYHILIETHNVIYNILERTLSITLEQHKTIVSLYLEVVRSCAKTKCAHDKDSITEKKILAYSFSTPSPTLFTNPRIVLPTLKIYSELALKNWQYYFICIEHIIIQLQVIAIHSEKFKTNKVQEELLTNFYNIIFGLNAFFIDKPECMNKIWSIYRPEINAVLLKMPSIAFTALDHLDLARCMSPQEALKIIRNLVGSHTKTYLLTFRNSLFTLSKPDLFVVLHDLYDIAILPKIIRKKITRLTDIIQVFSFQENFIISLIDIDESLAITFTNLLYTKTIDLIIAASNNNNIHLSFERYAFYSLAFDNTINELAKYFSNEFHKRCHKLIMSILNFHLFYFKSNILTNENSYTIIDNIKTLISSILSKKTAVNSKSSDLLIIDVMKKIIDSHDFTYYLPDFYYFLLDRSKGGNVNVHVLLDAFPDQLVPIAKADIKIHSTINQVILNEIECFNACYKFRQLSSDLTQEFFKPAQSSLLYCIQITINLKEYKCTEAISELLIEKCNLLLKLLLDEGMKNELYKFMLFVIFSPIGIDFTNRNTRLITKILEFICLKEHKTTEVATMLLLFDEVNFWSVLCEDKVHLLQTIFKHLLTQSNESNTLDWKRSQIEYIKYTIGTKTAYDSLWCWSLPNPLFNKYKAFKLIIENPNYLPEVKFFIFLKLDLQCDISHFVANDNGFLFNTFPKLNNSIKQIKQSEISILNFLFTIQYEEYLNQSPIYLRNCIGELILQFTTPQDYSYLLYRLLDRYLRIPLNPADTFCLQSLSNHLDNILKVWFSLHLHSNTESITTVLRSFICQILRYKKYSLCLIPILLNFFAKQLFPIQSTLMQDDEIESFMDIYLECSREGESYENFMTIIPNAISQKLRLKGCIHYFEHNNPFALKLLTQFLSKYNKISIYQENIYDLIHTIIYKLNLENQEILINLLSITKEKFPSKIDGISLLVQEKIERETEKALHTQNYSNIVAFIKKLLTSKLFLLTDKFEDLLWLAIKQNYLHGIDLHEALDSVPIKITEAMIMGFAENANLSMFDKWQFIKILDRLDYLHFTESLKNRLDVFVYRLFTNLELTEQLHIPLSIINTNMFTYLGSTLPIKKKSKLFYYFYLSIIVSIQDLNARQIINTVRLRAHIVLNYSELNEFDTLLQKKLRSIPINTSVVSTLLGELNEAYKKDSVPFDFTKYFVDFCILIFARMEKNYIRNSCKTLLDSILIIHYHGSISDKLLIIEESIKIQCKFGFYVGLSSQFKLLLDDSNLVKENPVRIEKIFSNLIKNFTMSIDQTNGWHKIIRYLEHPSMVTLFINTDKRIQLFIFSLKHCLADRGQQNDLTESKWQIVELVATKFTLKHPYLSNLLEVILNWLLVDNYVSIEVVDYNLKRLIKIFSEKFLLEINDKELLRKIWSATIKQSSTLLINDGKIAHKLFKYLVPNFVLNYHPKDKEDFFEHFTCFFTSPLAMHFSHLKKNKLYLHQFIEEVEQDDSLKTVEYFNILKQCHNTAGMTISDTSALLKANSSICCFITMAPLFKASMHIKQLNEELQKHLSAITIQINKDYFVDIDRIHEVVQIFYDCHKGLLTNVTVFENFFNLLNKLNLALKNKNRELELIKVLDVICSVISDLSLIKLYLNSDNLFQNILMKISEYVAHLAISAPMNAYDVFHKFILCLFENQKHMPPNFRKSLVTDIFNQLVLSLHKTGKQEVISLISRLLDDVDLFALCSEFQNIVEIPRLNDGGSGLC